MSSNLANHWVSQLDQERKRNSALTEELRAAKEQSLAVVSVGRSKLQSSAVVGLRHADLLMGVCSNRK